MSEATPERSILGDLLPADSMHRVCWFPPGYDAAALAQASSEYKLSIPWLLGTKDVLEQNGLSIQELRGNDIIMRVSEILNSLSMQNDLDRNFDIIFYEPTKETEEPPSATKLTHTYGDLFDESVSILLMIVQNLCVTSDDIVSLFADFSIDVLFAIFNCLQHRAISSERANALLCLAMFMIPASHEDTAFMLCDLGALDILCNFLTRSDTDPESVKNAAFLVKTLYNRVPAAALLPPPVSQMKNVRMNVLRGVHAWY